MIINYFFYFIIYAFLGYVVEVCYVYIGSGKLTNRGYLYGPICPIYGYGAVIILLCLNPVYESGWWPLVFILGVALTSLLEYATSYVMEALFHMRWWDYSNKRFNLNGRICLKNSLLFGVLVMVVFYVIQPFISSIVSRIDSEVVKLFLFYLLLILHIVDTVLSTIKHINLTKVLLKIDEIIEDGKTLINGKTIQLKAFLNNTKLMKRILRLNRHYPSLKVKDKNKRKLSLKEIINRIRTKE